MGEPLTCFRHSVKGAGIVVGAVARAQKLIVPAGADTIKGGDTV